LENRWKPFLNKILLKNDYNIVYSRIKNQTETIHYRSTIANPATEIRVGYLKPNLLIFLTIYNPEVPGYNTSFKGEYFDQYSFHPKKNYGNPGLEYNEMNKVGLTK